MQRLSHNSRGRLKGRPTGYISKIDLAKVGSRTEGEVTRERAIQASARAVQTLAQGQGRSRTPEYGKTWPGRRSASGVQAKAWRWKWKACHLVTRPSLMAAPRHHACAVHEKETN